MKCNDNKISLNKDEKLSICTSFGLWGSVVVRVGISVTGHWPCLNVEMHEITGWWFRGTTNWIIIIKILKGAGWMVEKI